jgi:flagellar hook-length control protein FliK
MPLDNRLSPTELPTAVLRPAMDGNAVAAASEPSSGGNPALLAVPQTDEGTATPADTAATQVEQHAASSQAAPAAAPAVTAAPAMPSTAAPRTSPLSRPNPIAGTGPDPRPAAKATRRGEANDRQHPAQALPREPAGPVAQLPAVDQNTVAAVDRPAGSAQPLAVTLKSAGRRSAISAGAALTGHDADAAAPAAPSAQLASPIVTETPASISPASMEQQAAATGAPVSALPMATLMPPPVDVAPGPASMTTAPNDAQRLTARPEPQAPGAAWVLPALPQSDDAPVEVAAGAAKADDAFVLPGLALPLPVAASAGTAPATRPAAIVPRGDEVADRRQPVQAGTPSAAEALAIAPTQFAAPIAPLGDANMPQALPTARPRAAGVESISAAARKPVSGVPLHGTPASAAESQQSTPDGPSLAAHDAVVGAPIASSASSVSPVATDSSLALLPAGTQTQAAVPTAPTVLDAPRPAFPSPAEQVAPVLLSMAHAPDGAQRLTLRLDPADLGQVQIRIDRPPEAAARVEITVEKPETLILLLRDQPQLQHMLNQAGVPPEGRSVTFHLASPEAGPRYDGEQTPGGTGTGSPGTGDASNGASHQGGRPARGAFADTDDMKADSARAAHPGWVRAGLDITA